MDLSIEYSIIKMKSQILFAITALISCSSAWAYDLGGKVITVADGDTVKLLTADNQTYKIRLAGIDAPEKKQAFGNESKKTLSDCAEGKAATIDGNKKDRYDRIVGKVIVAGVDCNLRQIKLGMAWHYKKYEKEQEVEDRSIYAQEEYLAQMAGRGLWADTATLAPWDYRKQRKEAANKRKSQ